MLLIQDPTALDYGGLRHTPGLGPIGKDNTRGLWLHDTLAVRPDDGAPLGLLHSLCWARPEDAPSDPRGRNAKSIDEKESARWLEGLAAARTAARRMPQTQLVSITDREGDLYECFDQTQQGPPNLHLLVRAQHDRTLATHQKLWAEMAARPVGARRTLKLPRRHGQPARRPRVEVRWGPVTINAPAVGPKKGWPARALWAVWVRELHPPQGVEPLEWMLLSTRPVQSRRQALRVIEWYRRRWTIEEWHRMLKSGCGVERREMESVATLQRALAFDLIVAWRVLLLVKLGRAVPELPAEALFSPEELIVLEPWVKKTPRAAPESVGAG